MMHQGKISLENRPVLPPRLPGRLRALLGARAPAPAAVPEDVRIYAIGDVHGRLDLLDRLLEAVRLDSMTCGPEMAVEVVLLGDLIDRGPDSAGVVRRAMAPPGWARFQTLLGNHEHAMVEALAGDRAMARLWLGNGGETALASWGVDVATLVELTTDEVIAAARDAVPPEVRSWLSQRPLSIRRGDYYFVHAGVRPGVPLDRQQPRDALWIREDFLSSDRDHGVTVVHGHSIAEAVEERPNRIGIDTGAHATGRLTALALEGTRRWTLQT